MECVRKAVASLGNALYILLNVVDASIMAVSLRVLHETLQRTAPEPPSLASTIVGVVFVSSNLACLVYLLHTLLEAKRTMGLISPGAASMRAYASRLCVWELFIPVLCPCFLILPAGIGWAVLDAQNISFKIVPQWAHVGGLLTIVVVLRAILKRSGSILSLCTAMSSIFAIVCVFSSPTWTGAETVPFPVDRDADLYTALAVSWLLAIVEGFTLVLIDASMGEARQGSFAKLRDNPLNWVLFYFSASLVLGTVGVFLESTFGFLYVPIMAATCVVSCAAFLLTAHFVMTEFGSYVTLVSSVLGVAMYGLILDSFEQTTSFYVAAWLVAAFLSYLAPGLERMFVWETVEDVRQQDEALRDIFMVEEETAED